MTDLALAFVRRYGLVVLLFVFVLEGALVGKLIPTRGLFVAVVLAVGSGLFDYASIVAAAVIGATVGQSLLFLAIRYRGVDPTADDRFPLDDQIVERAERWFDRWGPVAVAAANVLPVVRGWMTVPTAMSRVPGYKFSAYSLVGSAAYSAGLVAIAIGIDGVLDYGPTVVTVLS